MDLKLAPYLSRWDADGGSLKAFNPFDASFVAPALPYESPIAGMDLGGLRDDKTRTSAYATEPSAGRSRWWKPALAASAVAVAGCGLADPEVLLTAAQGLGLAAWAGTSLAAGAHILATNNGRQPAIGWLAAASIPLVGPALWFAIGADPHLPTTKDPAARFWHDRYCYRKADSAVPDEIPPFVPEHFRPMLKLSRALTREPLLGGNRVQALHNGEEAYPSMLEAIESEPPGGFAYVGVYIFENNKMGEKFAAALRRAQERGVDVRVIVDRWGSYIGMPHDFKKIWRLYRERGCLPTSREILERHGVNFRRFDPEASLRNGLPWNVIYHKKILVTSGKAYLGSINLGDNYMLTDPEAVEHHQDIQFQIEGPAARRIEVHFRRDWAYLTGGEPEEPRTADARAGEDYVRIVPSMPDDDFENFKRIALAALCLAGAGETVRIRTGYFAPDWELLRAFEIAQHKGARVQLVLSEKNTVPAVDWAARQFFGDMLERGVELYYQPPPFDHSKIIVVGNHYVHVGSANIDRRSQTFHNEINAEIYSQRVAAGQNDRFDAILADPRTRRITRDWVDSWPLRERVRNGLSQAIARLY